MGDRRFFRFGGAVTGAWLALVYAFVSIQAIRSSLAGVPLPAPLAGDLGYYLLFGVVGGLLGLVVCWPPRAWQGLIAGLFAAGVLIFLLPWKDPFGQPGQTIGAQYHFLNTFLPPVVFMLVMTFMARQTIKTLPDRLEGSLSLRRLGWPLAATALAIVLGSLAVYPQPVQDGMRSMQGLVQQGLAATTQAGLPAPLQGVHGWFPNAAGKYTLSWSDDLSHFAGPAPLTPYTPNDFMVITRFGNGFSFACAYGPEALTTVCANFE